MASVWRRTEVAGAVCRHEGDLLPIPTQLIAQTQRPRGTTRGRVFVEVAGIEPASFDDDQGLLRAQSARPFLSPSALADASLRRGQSLLDLDQAPATGAVSQSSS